MVGLLRRARILPQPKVSKEEALQLAQAECSRRGWPWQEPVHVSEWFTAWYFMTNANYRGGNVNIAIDSISGRVRAAAFAPR